MKTRTRHQSRTLLWGAKNFPLGVVCWGHILLCFSPQAWKERISVLLSLHYGWLLLLLLLLLQNYCYPQMRYRANSMKTRIRHQSRTLLWEAKNFPLGVVCWGHILLCCSPQEWKECISLLLSLHYRWLLLLLLLLQNYCYPEIGLT